MALIPQIDNQFELKQTEKLIPSKTYKLMQSINTTLKKLKEPISVEGNHLQIDDVGELKSSVSILGGSYQATRSGKNICPMSGFNTMSSNGASNTYDNSTHTITMDVDATGSSGRYCKPVTNLEIGKTYTISFDIRGTSGKKVECGWNDARKTITLEENFVRYSSSLIATITSEPVVFYSKALANGGLASGEYMQFANVQVEKGDVATDYEEYGVMPSPDYPSEIENVEGINIWDEEWELGGLNSTGVPTNETDRIRSKNYIPVLPNTKYYYKVPNTIGVRYYDINKTFISSVNATNVFKTTPSNCYYIKFMILNTTEYNNNIIIAKNKVPTEYVPYNSLEVKVEGKNIWNKSELSEKPSTVNIAVGELNVKDVPIPFTFSSYLISNALTDTNVRVSFMDSNNSNIGAVKFGNTITSTNKRSFITINEIPEGTVKIKFGIRMQDGGHTEKTQLEKGELTDYEPYKSQVITFPLGEEKLMEGSYLADDGIHHTRKQVEIDVTQIRAVTSYNNIDYASIPKPADFIEYNSYIYYEILCNKAISQKITSWDNAENINKISSQPEKTKFYLGFEKGTTLEQMKTALANTVIEYDLAEPEIVPYTLEQQEAWNKLNNFSLYSPNSIITTSNDLAILKLTYYPVSSIDFETEYIDRIIGYADDLEAIQQVVYHILSIERNAYLIYDENYGIELEQYKGKDLDYIKATIDKVLKDALKHDLRITDVTVNNVEKITNDMVWINFTVNSIYGDLIMEVNVNV